MPFMLMSLSLLYDISSVCKEHSYHSRRSLSSQTALSKSLEDLEKRQKNPETGLLCLWPRA